jgi:hypothetical protein
MLRFSRAICAARCAASSSHVSAIFSSMARSSGERERLAIARHSSPCWRYCSVVCMTVELRMVAIRSNAWDGPPSRYGAPR